MKYFLISSMTFCTFEGKTSNTPHVIATHSVTAHCYTQANREVDREECRRVSRDGPSRGQDTHGPCREPAHSCYVRPLPRGGTGD